MRDASCTAPRIDVRSPLPLGARRQDPELRRRLDTLRPAIDIPRGWRDEFRRRAFLPPPAFIRGAQILASHVVPDGYVTVLRRVAAGPFAVLNPGAPQPSITDLQAQQWWAPNAAEHPPFPPNPFPIAWRLHLIQATQPPTLDVQAPASGTVIPLPFNAPQNPFAGDVSYLWPILETNVDELFPHVVAVGPTTIGIFADWQQPPPFPSGFALPYAFAQSWGILDGVDLRYDDPDVRRILLGGLG